MSQYDKLVESGELRPPTSGEQLAETAAGEGTKAEAARRVIEKRAERKKARQETDTPSPCL